jgi:hypothetical protein
MDYLVGRSISRKLIPGGIEHYIIWTSKQTSDGGEVALNPRLNSTVRIMADGNSTITVMGGGVSELGSLSNVIPQAKGFAADVAWSDGTRGDASVTRSGISASVAVNLG